MEYDIKTENWHCELVKSKVKMDLRYSVHRSSRDMRGIDKEVFSGFECSHQDQCGVTAGTRICIHPIVNSNN